MKIHTDYNVKPLNTFGVEAQVSYYVEIEAEEDIATLLRDEFFLHADKHIIGGGSNLLFTANVNGVAIKYMPNGIRVLSEDESSVQLELDAGVEWDRAVAYCCERNWWGIENLSLIPGVAGAAAVQNIGAYGVEIADVLISVEGYDLVDGERRVYTQNECDYSYRHSRFKRAEEIDRFLITKVRLRLSKKPTPSLSYNGLQDLETVGSSLSPNQIRERVISIRESKLPDPKVLGNAGSYFMNPVIEADKLQSLLQEHPDLSYHIQEDGKAKLSAAWLIDRCGYKGYRSGNVGTYEKHALIIVNYGGASGREVARLAEEIQQKVWEKYGVKLVPEVKYVGAPTYNYPQD
ncbi:MAG: UDP-N-acetylmuramate dehydrogenase [Porphyromonas sp.]|nr:UDP-N-acetylmuramate dehydrogenase [Porphyromonas sp.]